jgi:ABC-type Mn2+/Zn2+ transport system permease subunit
VCAVILAERWITRLVTGGAIAALASLIGLTASYQLDLPTGAAIVVACGLMLVLVSAIAALRGQGMTSVRG